MGSQFEGAKPKDKLGLKNQPLKLIIFKVTFSFIYLT
jgi:hypothetical protein